MSNDEGIEIKNIEDKKEVNNNEGKNFESKSAEIDKIKIEKEVIIEEKKEKIEIQNGNIEHEVGVNNIIKEQKEESVKVNNTNQNINAQNPTISETPSQSNVFSPPNMFNMDKDKLFETFLLFQNFMNSMNGVNNMNMNHMGMMMNFNNQNSIPNNNPNSNCHSPVYNNIRSPIIHTHQSPSVGDKNSQLIHMDNDNNLKKSQEKQIKIEELKITTPINEELNFDKSRKNSDHEKVNNDSKLELEKDKPPKNLYKESEKKVEVVADSQFTSIIPKEEIKTNDIKRQISIGRSKLNSTKSLNIQTEKSQETATTKPSYNFDDMPIKATQTNFIELLEKNLANLENEAEKNDHTEPKVEKRVHKPRFKKVINVSQPTEGKKYKYYSDNFDKTNKDKDKENASSGVQNKEEKKKEHHQTKENTAPTISNNRNNKFKTNQNKDRGKIFSPKKENNPPMEKPKKPTTLKVTKSSSNINSNFSSNPAENSLKKLRTINKEANSNKVNWSEAKFDDKEEIEPTHKTEEKTSHPLEFKSSVGENDKHTQSFSIGFTANISQPVSSIVAPSKKEDKSVKEESESEEEDNNTEGEESTVMFGNLDNEFLENIISGKLGTTPENNNNPNPDSTSSQKNKILENKELLNSKIKEINYEIIKLKGENEKVAKLKIEYEKLTKKLNSELKELNERKERELRELETWKEEEVKKMLKEKKVHERNLKQIQNQGPSKKDKDEIEVLKLQIVKLHEDFKIKENTNKLMIDRLKKQLDEANLKISELVKIVEEKDVKSQNDNNKLTSVSVKKSVGMNSVKSKKNLELNFSEKKETLKKESSKKQVVQKSISNNLLQSNQLENEAESFDLVFLDKYHNESKPLKVIKSEQTQDGKIIRVYENEKREVVFPSGVVKEIHSDGYQIVYFTNKDIKQVYPSGKTVYFFNEAKTVQTTFPDNLQIFKFENGQIEKHYPDGSKQISFPDGSLRYILPDGYEETFYPDGTIQKVDKDGVNTIEREDGIKEIKYPDGKEEIIYPNEKEKSISNKQRRDKAHNK